VTAKVLVTGGCGFIGSHIVDALVQEGYSVGILDNLSTGDRDNVREHLDRGSVILHSGDVRDFTFVEKTVVGYDVVIHEAALVSVTRSVENPLTTNEVNINGTLNVLWAAVKAKVGRFIYASSSSVYGETETLPKTETMRTVPISPYGASKLAAENYCKVFAKVYGLRTINLRYFNVYGPRQKYGPYSGVIPIFIRQVAKGEPPTIYGDGKQSRDFTFVSDVVKANLLCLEKDIEPGAVFNIAAGRPVTVNRLASTTVELMGKEGLAPRHVKSRAGDIRHSYADIGKARDVLGYSPEVKIEEGLRRLIEWMKTNAIEVLPPN
jgi:UDP-glucose 4-epimerase